MSTYTWQTLYDQAVHDFAGQLPSRTLETKLIEVFRERPAAVQQALAKTAQRFANGQIHSPWPIVAKELEHDQARSQIQASTGQEASKAEHQAAIEIRNALHYLATEDELVDELFGQHGQLRNHDQDHDMRQRMIDLWQTERPRGIKADEAVLERAARYRQFREAERERAILATEPG